VAKNSVFSVSISGNSGYGKFTQAMLEAKTVSLFEKWQKKSMGFEISRDVAEGMLPVLKMVKLTKAITSKEFQNEAKLLLLERLQNAQHKKFTTSGFGKWSPLKQSTKKWRDYIRKVIFGSLPGYQPLYFFGSLETAVVEGLKITKFDFFSHSEYSKGYLKLNNLKIKADWNEPKVNTRERYFHMTAHSIRTFRDLVEFHRRTGRYAFLTPTLDIMSGDEVDFSKSLTRGEFFRYVWSPFVKQDFEKIFRTKRYKTGSETEIVSQTLNVSDDMVMNLDKEGTVSKDLIQKKIQELLKKKEKTELTQEEWDFLAKYWED